MTAGRALTPKTLILDLLRVAQPGSVPVHALVAVGDLFALNGNAMRVALARLVARGLVESDERGSYRLSHASDALRAHVEEWRLGEARLAPWDGGWLTLWLPRGGDRGARRRSVRALARLGFAEGLDGVHVRPDNLAGGAAAARARLAGLGLERGAELASARAFDAALVARWEKRLWPLARLERGYTRALADIEASRPRVVGLPLEQAVVETFRVGGNAIHALATDPLLPHEIQRPDARRALTDAMIEYDAIGRDVWARLASAERRKAA